MTAPEGAFTTPDTDAVEVGPPGPLSPHAARSIDVSTALATVGIGIENRIHPSAGEVRSQNTLPRAAEPLVLLPSVESNLLVQPIMPVPQSLLIEPVARVIPAERLGLRRGGVQELRIGFWHQVV